MTNPVLLLLFTLSTYLLSCNANNYGPTFSFSAVPSCASTEVLFDVSYLRLSHALPLGVRVWLCVDSSNHVNQGKVATLLYNSLTLDSVGSGGCNNVANNNLFYVNSSNGDPTFFGSYTDGAGLSFGRGTLCLKSIGGQDGVIQNAVAANQFFPAIESVYVFVNPFSFANPMIRCASSREVFVRAVYACVLGTEPSSQRQHEVNFCMDFSTLQMKYGIMHPAPYPWGSLFAVMDDLNSTSCWNDNGPLNDNIYQMDWRGCPLGPPTSESVHGTYADNAGVTFNGGEGCLTQGPLLRDEVYGSYGSKSCVPGQVLTSVPQVTANPLPVPQFDCPLSTTLVQLSMSSGLIALLPWTMSGCLAANGVLSEGVISNGQQYWNMDPPHSYSCGCPVDGLPLNNNTLYVNSDGNPTGANNFYFDIAGISFGSAAVCLYSNSQTQILFFSGPTYDEVVFTATFPTLPPTTTTTTPTTTTTTTSTPTTTTTTTPTTTTTTPTTTSTTSTTTTSTTTAPTTTSTTSTTTSPTTTATTTATPTTTSSTFQSSSTTTSTTPATTTTPTSSASVATLSVYLDNHCSQSNVFSSFKVALGECIQTNGVSYMATCSEHGARLTAFIGSTCIYSLDSHHFKHGECYHSFFLDALFNLPLRSTITINCPALI